MPAAHRLQQRLLLPDPGRGLDRHEDPHQVLRVPLGPSSPGVLPVSSEGLRQGLAQGEGERRPDPGDQPRGVHGRVGDPDPGPDEQIQPQPHLRLSGLCARSPQEHRGVLLLPTRDLPLRAAGLPGRYRGHQDRQSGRRFSPGRSGHGRFPARQGGGLLLGAPGHQPAPDPVIDMAPGPARHPSRVGVGGAPPGHARTADPGRVSLRRAGVGRGGLAHGLVVLHRGDPLGDHQQETLLRPARGRPHGCGNLLRRLPPHRLHPAGGALRRELAGFRLQDGLPRRHQPPFRGHWRRRRRAPTRQGHGDRRGPARRGRRRRCSGLRDRHSARPTGPDPHPDGDEQVPDGLLAGGHVRLRRRPGDPAGPDLFAHPALQRHPLRARLPRQGPAGALLPVLPRGSGNPGRLVPPHRHPVLRGLPALAEPGHRQQRRHPR